MTTEDLKNEFGEDILFLFKGTEPFTRGDNNAPMGMLLTNIEGKVMCYECGHYFNFLAPHLHKEHDMSADEFKVKYGLKKDIGLCSIENSRIRSEQQIERMQNNPEKFKNFLNSNKFKRTKEQRTGVKKTMQQRNKENTCPAQVKARYVLLKNKLGHVPTIYEARKHDKQIVSLSQVHFGGWEKLKEIMNDQKYKSLRGSARLKREADLIYDLRKFVDKYKKLPWVEKETYEKIMIEKTLPKVKFKHSRKTHIETKFYDYRRKATNVYVPIKNFPYSRNSYVYIWGSYSKAWQVCGIKCLNNAKGKWDLVDNI